MKRTRNHKLIPFLFAAGILTIVIVFLNKAKIDNYAEKNNIQSKNSDEFYKAPVKTKLTSINEQKKILENELKFFDQPFEAYSYCNSEADLQNILGMFSAWAALIEAREKSENMDVQNLVKQLKEKVIYCQVKSFPIFRKEYLRLVDNKIIVHVDKLGVIGGSDIEYVDVEIEGIKNTNAICSWWGFVSEKNKIIFQRKFFDTLAILRFKQVKLQVNSADTEPFYFKPFEGEDNELIVLDKKE